MSSDTPEKPKDSTPRRRWFRFSLRTLLILTVLLSVALGLLGSFLVRIRHQRRIVTRIEAIGASVRYDAWAYVTSVRLWGHPTNEGQELAALIELPRLKRVSLEGPGFTDQTIVQLSRIPQLRGLQLRDTSVTSKGIGTLRTAPNLEVLSLHGESIDNQALRSLSPTSRIRCLWLLRTSVTSTGFTEIHTLKELRELHIGEVPWELRFIRTKQLIDDEAMPNIGKLTNLETLTLFGTAVSDEGLRHLRGLQQLVRLEISETDISDPGAKEIAHLRNLKDLSLLDTKVGDFGLHELAKLPSLEKLNLGSTRITDEGVTDLLAMSTLRSLDVSQTKITDSGLRRLIAHPSLEEIEFGPDLSPELVEEFRRESRHCRATYNDPSQFSLTP